MHGKMDPQECMNRRPNREFASSFRGPGSFETGRVGAGLALAGTRVSHGSLEEQPFAWKVTEPATDSVTGCQGQIESDESRGVQFVRAPVPLSRVVAVPSCHADRREASRRPRGLRPLPRPAAIPLAFRSRTYNRLVMTVLSAVHTPTQHSVAPRSAQQPHTPR